MLLGAVEVKYKGKSQLGIHESIRYRLLKAGKMLSGMLLNLFHQHLLLWYCQSKEIGGKTLLIWSKGWREIIILGLGSPSSLLFLKHPFHCGQLFVPMLFKTNIYFVIAVLISKYTGIWLWILLSTNSFYTFFLCDSRIGRVLVCLCVGKQRKAWPGGNSGCLSFKNKWNG